MEISQIIFAAVPIERVGTRGGFDADESRRNETKSEPR